MKYVSLLMLVCLFGCVQPTTPLPIPAGYTACHTDYDCDEDRGEFCGFIKMDTPPVCRR